jgi:hypothetical protein
VRVESVLGHGVGAVSFDITPAQAARLDELDGEV